eukprot:9236313-Alexandrium_andersonii.AAC.1
MALCDCAVLVQCRALWRSAARVWWLSACRACAIVPRSCRTVRIRAPGGPKSRLQRPGEGARDTPTRCVLVRVQCTALIAQCAAAPATSLRRPRRKGPKCPKSDFGPRI